MMQQVASPNADIAAFTANTGQNKQNQGPLAGGFEQVLRQQRESSSVPRSHPGDVNGPGNERDKISHKTSAAEPAVSERGDSANMDQDSKQEALSKEQHTADDGGVASSDKSQADDVQNAKGAAQGADQGPADSDVQSVAAENTTQTEPDNQPQLAEDWVSLVGKLQSLANIGQGENAKDLLNSSDTMALIHSTEKPLQGDKSEAKTPAQLAELLVAKVSLESESGNEVDGNASASERTAMAEQLSQMLQDSGRAPDNAQTADLIKQIEGLLNQEGGLSLDNKGDQELLALLLSAEASSELIKTTAGEDTVLNAEQLSAESTLSEQLLKDLPKSLEPSEAHRAPQLQGLNEAKTLNTPQQADLKAEYKEIKSQLNTEKSGAVDPLALLVNIPEGKLEKALNNLAQRIVSTASESNVPSANQEFIGALQSAVSELKHQLSKGREPGIDLPGLVAEAMSKANISAQQPEQVEVKVKAFTQVMDFAQQLSSALDVSQVRSAHALNIEAGQVQIEQLKQSQIPGSQLGAQLDKAINIAKPEGHQQLAEKVRWMVNAKQLVADIRLDPAELGSMQVKVSVSGESATVNFVVQSHHARDALENATPKLRELLGQQGIELGQSSVRQDQGEQGGEEGKSLSKGDSGIDSQDAGDEQDNENVIQQPIVNGALGGIDYFV